MISAVFEQSHVPKWSYKRANWEKFKLQCQHQLTEDAFEINLTQDINDVYERFIQSILEIATNNIPQSKSNPSNKTVPYWTDACQNAIKKRSEALLRMRRTKDPTDCMEYRRCKGIAQKVIKEAKKASWRNYCGTLNTRTKMSEIWRTTKRMSGVKTAHNIPTLKSRDQKYESNYEKAELFAETFARVSADENHSPDFIKNRAKFHPEFPTAALDTDILDDDFAYHELRQAVQQCKRNSSPGQDTISYEILKEIPKSGLLVLLKILNHTWAKGKLPADWKHALVTPILKPTKPNNDPTSYRPISLTSSICKIMERLISNRLGWYLEQNQLLNKNQSGFRRNRACIDQIMRLQDDINKNLHTKGNVV